MTLNRRLRNYLIDCLPSFNYATVNIFRRRRRSQTFNGRQRFTKSCALYVSAFNLFVLFFLLCMSGKMMRGKISSCLQTMFSVSAHNTGLVYISGRH